MEIVVQRENSVQENIARKNAVQENIAKIAVHRNIV